MNSHIDMIEFFLKIISKPFQLIYNYTNDAIKDGKISVGDDFYDMGV
jgi:hypothetical protein